MSRKHYIFLFFLALILFSVNLIFQQTAGYFDSQYYFLGGKSISNGSFSSNVIWNYLDDPQKLPYPLFTYWMPLPGMLSAIFMWLFSKQSFFLGRLPFLLLSALIPPLTAYISFHYFKNRFSALVAGSLAIFSGIYFKFFAIPETISLYILLGALFVLSFQKLLSDLFKDREFFVALVVGILAGLLHLTRVDGLIFLLVALVWVSFQFFQFKGSPVPPRKILFFRIGLIFSGYLLITGWWYIRNLTMFGTLLSPASSHAVWIANYDDTFIYPASQLNFTYWLNYGFQNKALQIWQAVKLNFANLIAVQLSLVGLPLFILSFIKRRHSKVFLLPLILFSCLYVLMTFVFSLAGGRGGYIHAMASLQIFFWILIADGLTIFLEWGIRRRNWKKRRSQIMFGSALIICTMILTFVFYQKDVLGNGDRIKVWDYESTEFQQIEMVVAQKTNSTSDVIMINNPIGYNLATDRGSIVIPSAKWTDLSTLIDKFHVKYIVLDSNLPKDNSDISQWETVLQLVKISSFDSGKILYEVP